MKYALIGWLAVGAAYWLDRFWKQTGSGELIRVGLLVPIEEELIKFIACYLFGLSPLVFFGVFGLGEGFHKFLLSDQQFNPASMVSDILVHLVFSLGYFWPGPVGVSLTLAIGAHIIWNNVILYLTKQKLG